MPRVSRLQADRNRESITEASARLFREQGIKGVSVADLMAAAGLTHGGFYGHFESKDDLAAVACQKAFEKPIELWTSQIERKRTQKSALNAIVEAYLATADRDDAGKACPAAMLATDVARESDEKPIRDAYLSGVKTQLEILTGLQNSGDARRDRRQAFVVFSTMIGALLLARATNGDPISDDILDAARRHIGRKEEA